MWSNYINICSRIFLRRKANLLKRKPTTEMVQICRENGLAVRGRIWLWLDRNITALDLSLQLLYRPLLSLFSPSGSHILYPPASWMRSGRRNALYRCHAHQVHSPTTSAETYQKGSFTFQTQRLIQGCDISGFLKYTLLYITPITS